MKGYLLDTSVLSGLAPGGTMPSPDQIEWFRRENEGLFVPSVAIAEIFEGIAKLRRAGEKAQADRLAGWMEQMNMDYGNRILLLDVACAQMTGELADAARAAGGYPGFAHVAIAAIASINGLTVATRDLRHFEATGVSCLDPFASRD